MNQKNLDFAQIEGNFRKVVDKYNVCLKNNCSQRLLAFPMLRDKNLAKS